MRLDVYNPAHPDELVGAVPRATPDDVNRAIAAAKAAQPDWGALGYRARAARITEGLTFLSEGAEQRSVLYVRENGKTLFEASRELLGLADRLAVTLEYVDELEAIRRIDSPIGEQLVTYRPYGVAVIIVPWNSPVTLAFGHIVAALLAGNSVVVKPPETAPLALIASIDVFARNLPASIINVITGLPDEIGDALTTHPSVGKISFTGSIRAARQISSNAAQSIKSLTLELGGNDAAILLDDADLSEKTMDRMLASVFSNAGQICMAIKRIYVHDDIADAFYQAFREAAGKIVVGDGLAPGVTMGPLHTNAALTRATGLIEDARSRGATVELLGQIQDQSTFSEGHFMQPTMVTDIDPDAPLVTEEQFSPSVPIVRFRDIDEVVACANGTIYGLGGSVWGRDFDRALAVAKRLEAGTVWVNNHGTRFTSLRAPLGGMKQSGVGYVGGLEGLLAYLEAQTIVPYDLAAL